jgi:dienelactone hydrolase
MNPLLQRLVTLGVAAGLVASLFVSSGCQRTNKPTNGGPSPIEANKVPTEASKPKTSGAAPTKGDPFAPLVEVADEDYAQARERFRTRLTRKGPSPQPFDPVEPPTGVIEIEYPSGDLRLKAWLSRPADERGKHPAVLFLHGGFAFGAEDWEISQPYRTAGYVVLAPMLRGENGQPGAYSFYYDEVADVLAAAEYLCKLPYVNADNLYIAGPSAGGTLVLLAAMTSKQFRGAASFSAMTDQVLFCKHAKNAARDIPVDITNLRELQVRSPLAYAASFKCPARLYYGSEEPHLGPMSRRTASLAKARALNVEAIQVEGDHGTSVPPGIQQSIAFFQKN